MEPPVETRTDAEATTVTVAGQSDQPTDEDTLGFRPYVEAISEFLVHPNTQAPLVLSVEGDWGVGKTSFMAQLEARLDARGRRCIRFNAWRHDKAEELWAAFALHMVRELGRTTRPFWRRWLARGRLFFERFGTLAGWRRLLLAAFWVAAVPWVGYTLVSRGPALLGAVLDARGDVQLRPLLESLGLVGLAILALVVLRRLHDLLGRPLELDLQAFMDAPAYRRHTAFIEDFHRDFTRIVRAYAPGERVYVFIDDMDRAAVPKAAELVQALNLMIADSPQLVFIIGMDREKVAAGLAVKYKDMLPYLYPGASPDGKTVSPAVGIEFGSSFIEKFVQLAFRIPMPTERELRQFLQLEPRPDREREDAATAGVRQMVEDVVEGADSDRFKEVVLLVAPALDHNPRRIKQFMNAFRLQAHITARTGLFEEPAEPELQPLTLERLGKFVALMLRWPRIIADLIEEPRMIDELHHRALSEHHVIDSLRARAWADRPEMLALLARGIEQRSFEEERRYGLLGLDVERLLKTSPIAVRPADRREEPARREASRKTSRDDVAQRAQPDLERPRPSERPDEAFAQTGSGGLMPGEVVKRGPDTPEPPPRKPPPPPPRARA